MRVEFDLETELSPEEVYRYFETPECWPDLFTAFAAAHTNEDGWTKVPIHRSPFVLTARNTRVDAPNTAQWVLRGFWSGNGAVALSVTGTGTRIVGFEEVRPPLLLRLGGILERWAEPRFTAVWETGWRQIRRIET